MILDVDFFIAFTLGGGAAWAAAAGYHMVKMAEADRKMATMSEAIIKFTERLEQLRDFDYEVRQERNKTMIQEEDD